MNRKKLRRWLLIGLFATSMALPIVRVATDVSAALNEAAKSAQRYELRDQVADPTGGGAGGGGGG